MCKALESYFKLTLLILQTAMTMIMTWLLPQARAQTMQLKRATKQYKTAGVT